MVHVLVIVAVMVYVLLKINACAMMDTIMQLTVLCPLVLLRQHGQENPIATTLTISHIYLLSAVIWAYVIENLVCVNVSRV